MKEWSTVTLTGVYKGPSRHRVVVKFDSLLYSEGTLVLVLGPTENDGKSCRISVMITETANVYAAMANAIERLLLSDCRFLLFAGSWPVVAVRGGSLEC